MSVVKAAGCLSKCLSGSTICSRMKAFVRFFPKPTSSIPSLHPLPLRLWQSKHWYCLYNFCPSFMEAVSLNAFFGAFFFFAFFSLLLDAPFDLFPASFTALSSAAAQDRLTAKSVKNITGRRQLLLNNEMNLLFDRGFYSQYFYRTISMHSH